MAAIHVYTYTTILVFIHLWIIKLAWEMRRNPPPGLDPNHYKKEWKITKMLILVVVLYLLCNVSLMVASAHLTKLPTRTSIRIYYFATVLFYVNSWINPFMYAWKDEAFKRAFNKMIPECIQKCQQRRVAPLNVNG